MARVIMVIGLVLGVGSITKGNAQTVETATILPAVSLSNPKEDFTKLVDTLKAMNKDMQLFNLNGIHPRLEQLYRLYDGLIGLTPEVGKLKTRTETIHRLFDAGELEVSGREAQELLRHAEKLKARFDTAGAP